MEASHTLLYIIILLNLQKHPIRFDQGHDIS